MVKGRRRDKGQKVKYSSSAEKNPGICKTRSDTSSNSSKHSENRSQNESKNANKVKTRSSSRGGGSCSGSVEQISGSYKTCGDSSSGDSKQKSIEPTDIAKKAKTRMSTRSGGTTSSSNGGSTSSSSGSSTSSSSSGQLESGGSGDIPGTSKKSQRTKKSNPIGSDLRPNEVESQNTKKVKTRMSSRGADSGSNSGERLSDSYKTCGDSSSDDSKQRVIVATDIGKRAKTPMSSISGGTISSSRSCQLESGGNDNIPGTSRKSQRTKKSNPTGSDLKSSSSKQSPVVPQNVESAQMRSSLRSNDSIPKSHEQIEVVPQIAEAVKTRQRKCNEKKNYFETKTAEKQGRKSYNKKRKELPGKPVRVNEISLKDAVPVVAARKNSRVRRGSGDSELEGDNDANSKGSRIAPFLPKCNLWSWDGKSYHRVSKNGFQKHFYKSIIRGEEKISVGDCAVLLSTGQPDHPYIGRIVSMWELSPGNKKKLRAKWYYHPAEVKGCPKLKWQGALFESSHEDENDVQTISHRCEVISFADYIAKFGDDPRQHQAANDNNDTYYLAGVYKPALKTFTLKNNIPTEVENKTQTN